MRYLHRHHVFHAFKNFTRQVFDIVFINSPWTTKRTHHYYQKYSALSLWYLQKLSDFENIVKGTKKTHSQKCVKVTLICSLRLPCWKCQNLAHAYIWTTIKSIVPLICWIFGRIPSSLILFFFCLFLEKSEVTVAILDDKASFPQFW